MSGTRDVQSAPAGAAEDQRPTGAAWHGPPPVDSNTCTTADFQGQEITRLAAHSRRPGPRPGARRTRRQRGGVLRRRRTPLRRPGPPSSSPPLQEWWRTFRHWAALAQPPRALTASTGGLRGGAAAAGVCSPLLSPPAARPPPALAGQRLDALGRPGGVGFDGHVVMQIINIIINERREAARVASPPRALQPHRVSEGESHPRHEPVGLLPKGRLSDRP